MSLKQMQLLDGASTGKQEPIRIMGFDCVCGRRMTVSAEQGLVPAPQRTWVGLTDRDVDGLVEQYWDNDNMTVRSMMRAIEAKLKEKNT